jgi:hypothetical protein
VSGLIWMSGSGPQEWELTRGVWIELLDDEAVLAVRVATIERAAIDCLYSWLHERMNSWDERQPWLALYDLTTPGAMLTPYMRRRVIEFAMLRPEVSGRVAFVMRRDATTALFNLVQAGMPTRARALRVWFHRREALAWLRELLK